jgi:hypothetical protein
MIEQSLQMREDGVPADPLTSRAAMSSPFAIPAAVASAVCRLLIQDDRAPIGPSVYGSSAAKT